MTRLRSNPKEVSRICGLYLAAFREVMKKRGTLDAYTSKRGEIAKRPVMTRGDEDQIFGYSRALWDAVWISVEWRLGTADPLTATTPWPYGKGLPTHGGFFWTGTDIVFTDWKPLSDLTSHPVIKSVDTAADPL